MRGPGAFVYTATRSCDLQAWERGQERFPKGATIRVNDGTEARDLVPGFVLSADPEVSFDGQRILFAGKKRLNDPWQIWEAGVAGGQPTRITHSAADCIRPLYLPVGKIVYAYRQPDGFQLEVLAMGGGQALQITYAPGNHLPNYVLRDGRILYESPHPGATSDVTDLYTVYPDGSGVESYRCEHGLNRHAARQLNSGDVIFASGTGFGRFTSALTSQLSAIQARLGEFAGPMAEVSSEEWLAAFRPDKHTPFAIYSLNPAGSATRKISTEAGVQPVLLAAHETPLRFPSGLHDWAGANVLCLNAYTAKSEIAEGTIARVRLFGRGEDGTPLVLGEATVEDDGSFFLHVPSEQPLRMELLDRTGKILQAEHGWFWMRRGEQRVCVGCHAGPERAPENAVPKVLLRTDVPVNMPVHDRLTSAAGGGQ